MAGTGAVVTSAGLVFAATMAYFVFSPLRVMGQVGITIGLGLLFDTLVVRSFMMPSVAALMGRWFWWPQKVRSRPAGQMPRPYGSRTAVRAYMLPVDPDYAKHAKNGDSPNGRQRTPIGSRPARRTTEFAPSVRSGTSVASR
jgi:RND superfamily putative drug exporter